MIYLPAPAYARNLWHCRDFRGWRLLEGELARHEGITAPSFLAMFSTFRWNIPVSKHTRHHPEHSVWQKQRLGFSVVTGTVSSIKTSKRRVRAAAAYRLFPVTNA